MENTPVASNNAGANNKNILIAIIAAVIAVIIAFFIFMNLNKKYDTEYNNWSIMINENGEEYAIKLRQSSKKQAFELISKSGRVDFKVTDADEDEDKNKISYKSTKKFWEKDKYTIYPINELEEGKYYHLSLNDDTSFYAEEFKNFKDIYFTVKRDSVNECEVNPNIDTEKYINMNVEQVNDALKNGEINIEKGKIIIVQDEDGNSVCKTVGDEGLENTSLEDVFMNMNVAEVSDATELKFDPDKIDFDGIFKQDEIVDNVYNSDFFKNLTKEVYYDNKEFKDLDKSEIKNMISYKTYIDPVDNSRIGVRVAIKLDNEKLKTEYANVAGDVIVLLDLSCSFKITPDIDFRNKDELKLDVQFEISPRQYIDVEITGDGEGNEKLIEDIFKVAEADNNYIKFCEMNVPIPGLYYDAGVAKAGLRVDVPIGFVPQISAKLKLNYKQYKDNKITIGITNNSKKGSSADYKGSEMFNKDEIDDDWYFNLQGLLYASMGVRMEPKLVFEVSAGNIDDKDNENVKKVKATAGVVGYVGFGLESGPYTEFVGEIEARKNKETKTNANIEMGIYTKIDFVSNITLKAKIQVFNFNVGGQFEAGATYIFINKRYPFFEYPNSWYYVDANKNGEYDNGDKWYYYEISRYNNKTGWFGCEDDGQKYYLDPKTDGEMFIGLKQIGDEYYYFSKEYSKLPSWDKYDIRSEILKGFKDDNGNSIEFDINIITDYEKEKLNNKDSKATNMNFKASSKKVMGKTEVEYDKEIKKYKWIGKEKMKSLGSMYRNEEIPSDVDIPEGYTRRVDGEGRLIRK